MQQKFSQQETYPCFILQASTLESDEARVPAAVQSHCPLTARVQTRTSATFKMETNLTW